jgi:hypothetical protein
MRKRGMKLLGKTPVLDKGWVALYSSSLTGDDFSHVLKTHFRGTIDHRITDMTHVMLSIRCPLFVQLTFAEHGLLLSTEKIGGQPEAYIPDVSSIGSPDLDTSQIIQQDIEQTTAALLLNPAAYQQDNCDLFISQVISPISIYNTLIVFGSLTSWVRYIEQRSLPRPIEAYRKAIEDCLHGEWDKVVRTLREKNAAKKK